MSKLFLNYIYFDSKKNLGYYDSKARTFYYLKDEELRLYQIYSLKLVNSIFIAVACELVFKKWYFSIFIGCVFYQIMNWLFKVFLSKRRFRENVSENTLIEISKNDLLKKGNNRNIFKIIVSFLLSILLIANAIDVGFKEIPLYLSYLGAFGFMSYSLYLLSAYLKYKKGEN